VCHELEDAAHEREPYRLTDGERQRLRAAWDGLHKRMEPLLQSARGSVEFAEDDFKRLERAIREHAPPEQLQLLLQRLLEPSTAARLEAAKQHLLEVCQRLGKSPPEVTLVDHDLRLSSARFANFWSVFVHVLNNTADHGVEPDAVRLSSGKPLPAKVQLSTRPSAESVLVEVKDDGPGIDWSRVAARAQQRNLPFRTQQELVDALFSDAFSLCNDISEFSGRGVGLAAVKSAVAALRGSIEVESELGRGTKIGFRLALNETPPPL
jgi:two-component system, chemotaxis family, sensor kinase CheA